MGFEMPRPTAEHERLHRMVGSWIADETIHPSPWGPGGAAIGRATARVALDGLAVVTDYEQERDGRIGYRGHGVFGYDASESRWYMQWFDNMSPAPAQPVWGTWAGDTLTFEMQMPGRGHNRYAYAFAGDGYTFTLSASKDGQTWSTFSEGRFRRA